MQHNTYSPKFWTLFIVAAILFLATWFLFWEVRNRGLDSLKDFAGLAPISNDLKRNLETVSFIGSKLLDTEGKEKTFLLLFQNNLELRPGGGFVGSFGILKVRDGQITHFSTHDTGNFDGRIPDTVPAPYPIPETLKVNSWKLRDSNWHPDFRDNAEEAKRFYAMGGGEEQFDGVIGITANVLSSFLRVTGPVEIEGFPGTYGADNAILDLEYQVEQGYHTQGIEKGERKSVMGLLGNEILRKVKELSIGDQYELAKVIFEDLNQKDIQVFFSDSELEEAVVAAGWDGSFGSSFDRDFVFPVDANLGSFKSDYFVKRSYAYTVDLSREKPMAKLDITYRHTAEKRDWMTKEYQSFLRVYIPKESWVRSVSGIAKDPVYGEYRDRKWIGAIVQFPIGAEKTVSIEYDLPEGVRDGEYDLLFQKQAGLNDIPLTITVIGKDGTETKQSVTMNEDIVLSNLP